jgi:hypothetical protein
MFMKKIISKTMPRKNGAHVTSVTVVPKPVPGRKGLVGSKRFPKAAIFSG